MASGNVLFVSSAVGHAGAHQKQKDSSAVRAAELRTNGHEMVVTEGSHGVKSPCLLPLSVEAFSQSLEQLMSKHMAKISHSLQEALEPSPPDQ